MFKKLKIGGIVLLVVCLYSLCTARGVEAIPTPDKVLTRLQVRLDKIASVKINRADAEKISLAKFNNKLQKLERKTARRRDRFDENTAKVTWLILLMLLSGKR